MGTSCATTAQRCGEIFPKEEDTVAAAGGARTSRVNPVGRLSSQNWDCQTRREDRRNGTQKIWDWRRSGDRERK